MGLPRMAAPKMVVVGDDPALEMRMAVSAGAYGVGMTTGLMKRNNVRSLAAAEKPHALLESLEGLADKLR
jgi:NagD protein